MLEELSLAAKRISISISHIPDAVPVKSSSFYLDLNEKD